MSETGEIVVPSFDGKSQEEVAKLMADLYDQRCSLQAKVDAIPYWYHRIELPGGIVTPGWAPMDPSAYRIPDDLTGKSVLDVGAWDGYWSFEAAKRGSNHVVSTENFSDTIGANTNADRGGKWETLELCREALGLDTQVNTEECDIEDWESIYESIAYVRYDHIFCFGVLYHLKNPLKALENMRAICRGQIHIECAILDGMTSNYTGHLYTGDECVAEFYPTNEYGRNPSNWWVPTLKCLKAWVEAAGFRNVDSWRLTDNPQQIAHCRGFVRAEV